MADSDRLCETVTLKVLKKGGVVESYNIKVVLDTTEKVLQI